MANNQDVAAAMLAAIQALQATVGQLVQAQAQQQPAQQVPPVVPVPVPFATVPGNAMVNLLNLTKPEDLKFFYKAITPLPTKFNLTSDDLRAFLERVQDRARMYNWVASVLTIPDSSGILRNLVVNYGLLTINDCVAHATQQLAPGQEARSAQDSDMLYQFLTDSLTDEAKIRVGTTPHLYTVGPRMSGACYLKVIIGKSMIDTDATINTLRIQISNLSTKMVELKYNVKEFNSYVAVIRNSLLVRGEEVPELVINLFKAYLVVNDDEFVRYMRIKKDASDDGNRPSVDELLAVAENKYTAMVEDGSWKTKNAKDEKIFALESEIQRRDAAQTKGKQTKAEKWAWKKIPPKDNKKNKVVGPNTYYWCPKHSMWTVHRPEDCKLDEPVEKKGDKKGEKKVTKAKSTKKLSLAKAYRAMINNPQYVNDMEDEDEYEEDSDEE